MVKTYRFYIIIIRAAELPVARTDQSWSRPTITKIYEWENGDKHNKK